MPLPPFLLDLQVLISREGPPVDQGVGWRRYIYNGWIRKERGFLALRGGKDPDRRKSPEELGGIVKGEVGKKEKI